MLSDLRSESEQKVRKYDTFLLFLARFTRLFAYGALSAVLVFYLTGIGLCGGILPSLMHSKEPAPTEGYRAVVFCYAALGAVLTPVFAQLSSATEVGHSEDQFPSRAVKKTLLGVGHSREIVLKLSGLFALDSFGGGFVVQSLAAYWFYLRFGVKPAPLGAIFFGANLFAGVSALVASRLASRIGLVRTMVVLPLMPTLRLAIAVLLLRFSISQMDVPTRQSYTMAVVRPEERSAAAGITWVARTIGASIPPLFVGLMFARPAWINFPFFIAGSLKIAYDLLLYRQFVAIQPLEKEFR